MGMTDKQFEAYQKRVLRILKRAQEEVAAEGKSRSLDEMVTDMEGELQKP